MVDWPDAEGFWWAFPPGGPPTVCEAERCCGDQLWLNFIGTQYSYAPDRATVPDGPLHGYRFLKLDPPSTAPGPAPAPSTPPPPRP